MTTEMNQNFIKELKMNKELNGRAPVERDVRPPTNQPRLTVRLQSFPESNGRRNWTALLVRIDEFDGLVGSCGGITIDRGEFWNRVAYATECARALIGERDTEPDILDYGDDIKTPEQWAGEVRGGFPLRKHIKQPNAELTSPPDTELKRSEEL